MLFLSAVLLSHGGVIVSLASRSSVLAMQMLSRNPENK